MKLLDIKLKMHPDQSGAIRSSLGFKVNHLVLPYNFELRPEIFFVALMSSNFFEAKGCEYWQGWENGLYYPESLSGIIPVHDELRHRK